jgi:O-antigen/teichoic acid export membrane protein
VNPIVIGYLLGATAVATYYLPLRISTILFSSIAEIIGPQINFMIALYRDHNIHALLVKFFRIFIVVSLISFVAYSAFALFGPWAVRIWSIGKVAPSPALFWIMSLYYFLAMLQTMLACFITAHGLQPFARPAVAGAILNIGLLFILIPLLGLTGAALATFLAQLLTSNWFMPWYSARLFKEHFQKVPFRVALRDSVASLEGDLRHVLAFFLRK